MVQSEPVRNRSERFERMVLMIKLQDFARECGVTDRAIQKHLKTYAEELEGLYQRKGPNGTWLTEEACEIIRGKMHQQPMVVGDPEIYRMNEDLRQRVNELQEKLIVAHEQIQTQQQLLEQGQAARLMLHAAEEQTRQQAQELAELRQQLGAALQKAQDLENAAQEAAEAARTVAEAEFGLKEAELKRAAQAAQEELDDRKRHPWRYLFRR